MEDLHNRRHDDVLRHKPDWLSVMIGINDVYRTLANQPTAVPPGKFEKLYRSILERTRAATKAKIVLIDPFCISTDKNSQSFRAQVLRVLPDYIRVVHKMAREFHALSVQTHDVFQRQLKYYPADTFCPEPVHPYPSGHMVNAEALLRELGW